MTAFNVSSGAAVNWDTLSGGSLIATLDTYAISNNSTLVIDTDSYQCAGHSTAFGSVDTVSFSGIGGVLKLDGSKVRVIPFASGAGTVPAIGATITQGGVSAPLLGVWANWQSEPLAAAAAMPVSGWIKVKNVTGGAFAAGALTGITAVASAADKTGWIEVRGADTATITVPRIGKFEAAGEWFELGMTTGTRGQVLECPTTATIAGVFPGIWVETGMATGIYERFSGCGSMVNLATNPTDERGKIFWQTTAGIRLGSDGVNNVGFLPPTGCRVRIPNIIMTCCTRTAGGSGPRVLPNATLATRQEFVTTSAGNIVLSKAVANWFLNFQQAFNVTVLSSALSDTLIVAEIASPMTVTDMIVSPTQAQLNQALTMTSCFAGGVISDSRIMRFSMVASATYSGVVNFCSDFTFSNVVAGTLLNRSIATTGAWASTQSLNCTWIDCTIIGARIVLSACLNIIVRRLKYADRFSGTTNTLLPVYAIDASNACNGILVDGISFVALNLHPYTGLINLASCYNIKVRNIGTAALPLNFGTVDACGTLFNGSGNNDNMKIQRSWIFNTRLAPFFFLNSDNNVVIENLYSDYADTAVVAALNCIAKSLGQTGATTGQISVYGHHWKSSFSSATVGKIEISCNEPTALTSAQAISTAGTPRYNSAGQVALTAIGDQVTWEMPFFAIGLTALANLAPTLTGTNTANMNYEFQFTLGGAYNGAWLTLNAANQNAVGAIAPATGCKLKVRATCTVANAGNLLTNIAIPFVTSTADQNNSVYPLDQVALSLSGILSGSDVVTLAAGTSTVLDQVDQLVGSTYVYNFETAGVLVDIGILKTGFVPQYIRSFSLPTSNTTIPVSQVSDRNYVA